MLTIFSSLAALEFVKTTISGAAGDENFAKRRNVRFSDW